MVDKARGGVVGLGSLKKNDGDVRLRFSIRYT